MRDIELVDKRLKTPVALRKLFGSFFLGSRAELKGISHDRILKALGNVDSSQRRSILHGLVAAPFVFWPAIDHKTMTA
jgi:hypothetical protein